MILMFHRISATKQVRGEAFVPAWVFVAGYLLIWTVFGAVAYGTATGLERLGARLPLLHENGARIGGAVLALAGLYQFSPLKNTCLTRCRTPLEFILTSWKDGYGGAFRMGLSHGAYCLGCCWMLFVLLFPVGIMNVAAMGLVTLLLFAEKSLRQGAWIGKATGAGLLAFGLAVILVPGLLPTAL
jgi:predicted metal-binding membrane protein